MAGVFDTAIADIRDGLRRHRLWVTLATEDVLDQHRRTTLGPLWLLVNYFLFTATFVFVFAPAAERSTHAIYIAVGLLVWTYINEIITPAVSLFERESGLIRGTTLPVSVYILRMTLQALIRSGYSLIGCVVILAASGVSVTPAWGWSVAGIGVIMLISPALVTVSAFLGTYFPDSQFIVSNLMRIAMFITPVFWMFSPGDAIQGVLYHFNPFTYMIELVRGPVLTGEGSPALLFGTLLGGLVAWALALFLIGRNKRHLALIVP